MLTLSRLVLTDFRSYKALTWRPAAQITVLTGPNGSGKTNLLEAISLLTPGRGLRGARIAELARVQGSGRWAVAGRFERDGDITDIGTGTMGDGPADRRAFRLDGAEPRTQAELASRAAVIWLTPQMDGLFQESASGRRRFLDRLVWALEPAHAREAGAHDSAMSSRNKLLATGRADPAWLAGLEAGMARHAVALSAARASFVSQLNAASAGEAGSTGGNVAACAFPPARMVLLDPIADRLADAPALAVEEWLRAELARRRPEDQAAGGATLGAHRADMGLQDAASGLPAARASTGQQKALLLGVILAHAALITQVRGFAPILLLDEPAVHLDQVRRTGLYEALEAMPAQAILTGTDADAFAPLLSRASFLRLTGGPGLLPALASGDMTDSDHDSVVD